MGKNRILLVVLSLLFVLPSLAQTGSKKADEAFINHRWNDAISEYTKHYNKLTKGKSSKLVEEKMLSAYRIGYAYAQIFRVADGEQWLNKALTIQYANPDLEIETEGDVSIAVAVANCQVQQMKYPEAKKTMEKYFETFGGTEADSALYNSITFAKDAKENPTKHKVENLHRLNKNSEDFSCILANKKGNLMYFTSTRMSSENTEYDPSMGPNNNYSDIYATERDRQGEFLEPVPLGPEVNGNWNEGAPCMDPKFRNLYFTRCPWEKEANLGCDIYVAEGKKNVFEDAVKIANLKDNDSTNVGHPAIASDGKTMVFVSDISGGTGGKDLYITFYDKKSDSWSQPQELTGLNTPGDEKFPTFDENDNLYFSTDGREGMGGLDIFFATKVDGQWEWENPTNMGYPINSPRNDWGFVFDSPLPDGTQRGFLTSQRNEATGGKNAASLFTWNLPPITVDVIVQVVNFADGTPIAGATLKLLGPNGEQTFVSDDLGEIYITKQNGKQILGVNSEYELVVEKEDFFANGDKFDTYTTKSLKLVKEVNLQPIIKGAIEMPLVQYPLDDTTLLVGPGVNSKDSLEFLYDIMVNNPNLVVELMAHTDCRGDDDYNLRLSQGRANTCVAYLVERGIDPRRLVARGYGETTPYQKKDKDGIPTGPELKCAYIDETFATKEEREAAHQKNRRTEFQILSQDFDPNTAPPLEGATGEDAGGNTGEGDTGTQQPEE